MGDLDIRRLLLLKAVADAGSLSGAATRLAFTTSAVSQQIAKLEKEAGLPLVERHARGVRPTEAGEALVAHASRVEEQLAAARADMDEFVGLRRGRLDIGAFPTVGASLVPRVVVEMRRRHPDIRVSVASGRLDVLGGLLRRREVDLALLWDYAWAPLDESDLVVDPVCDDPTVLLLPKNHRLAGSGEVDVADMADEDWIIRAEHPVASVLERVCGGAGFAPHVVMSANDYPEVQGMVAAGIGIALAPRLAVLAPRDDVVVVPLTGNPAPRRILLARLEGRRVSPPALAALPVVKACAKALSP